MAHYALLDENNIVTDVIAGRDEDEDDADPEEVNGASTSHIDWEEHYGSINGQICKRTSINTEGGIHILGGTPFRKNFACIGYTYDYERDAFIPPKLFDSWILDEDTCLWIPPIPIPDDENFYEWDEENQSWSLISIENDE